MSIEASAALFSCLIAVFYSTWVIGAVIHNIPVAVIGLLFYLLCFYQLGKFTVDNEYLMTLLSCIISTSQLANITITLRFGKMFLLFINILIVYYKEFKKQNKFSIFEFRQKPIKVIGSVLINIIIIFFLIQKVN